jgi:hypothetical protein
MDMIVSISWRTYLSWDRGRSIVKHPNLLTPTSLLEESDHGHGPSHNGTELNKAEPLPKFRLKRRVTPSGDLNLVPIREL